VAGKRTRPAGKQAPGAGLVTLPASVSKPDPPVPVPPADQPAKPISAIPEDVTSVAKRARAGGPKIGPKIAPLVTARRRSVSRTPVPTSPGPVLADRPGERISTIPGDVTTAAKKPRGDGPKIVPLW
jgi:hypothetical protein